MDDIRPSSNSHSFRNMMLLILFAIGVWSWFHYLPQHAVSTITHINHIANTKLDTLLWVDHNQETSYDFNIPVISSWASTTPDTELTWTQINTWTIDANTWTLSEQETGSIWDEVDTTSNVSWTLTVPSNSWSVVHTWTWSILTIQIGWQTVTVDGDPDEDIIINADWYRVIVQKN